LRMSLGILAAAYFLRFAPKVGYGWEAVIQVGPTGAQLHRPRKDTRNSRAALPLGPAQASEEMACAEMA
jgi:hypothetical protein